MVLGRYKVLGATNKDHKKINNTERCREETLPEPAHGGEVNHCGEGEFSRQQAQLSEGLKG
jgi:hypothetical protein